jgi:hypothetical protein
MAGRAERPSSAARELPDDENNIMSPQYPPGSSREQRYILMVTANFGQTKSKLYRNVNVNSIPE